MDFRSKYQLYLRDNLFLPAGILSSVSAEWSDDRQAKGGDQGEGEREASLLDVAPIGRQQYFRDRLEACPYLQANLAKM